MFFKKDNTVVNNTVVAIPESNLVDSGERTTFNTGAKREITEQKGRCDLLPLLQISKSMEGDLFLEDINDFIQFANRSDLYDAIDRFIADTHGWMDNNWTMFLNLAKHYENGAKKYAERNWEKGLPMHSFIDSAIRHYFKWKREDKDEDHLSAILWNLYGALWTMDNLQDSNPELFDLPGFAVKHERDD